MDKNIPVMIPTRVNEQGADIKLLLNSLTNIVVIICWDL